MSDGQIAQIARDNDLDLPEVIDAIADTVALLKSEGWRIVKLEKLRWERIPFDGEPEYSYRIEEEL
jgi:hypothetical protein